MTPEQFRQIAHSLIRRMDSAVDQHLSERTIHPRQLSFAQRLLFGHFLFSAPSLSEQEQELVDLLRGFRGKNLRRVLALFSGYPGQQEASSPDALARGAFFPHRPDRERDTMIMVNYPPPEAGNLEFARQLIREGMDVARINLALDSSDTWLRMANTVREAARLENLPCQLFMDLAGPKLRIASIHSTPAALPSKKAFKQSDHPGEFWVVCEGNPLPGHGPYVCVPASLFQRLEAGMRISSEGKAGKLREWDLVPVEPKAWKATGPKSLTVDPEKPLWLHWDHSARESFFPTDYSGKNASCLVRLHDEVVLWGEEDCPEHGRFRAEHVFGLSEPAYTLEIKPGQVVLFDDGNVKAVCQAAPGANRILRVVDCPAEGFRLALGKSINLPDSDLPFSGLTAKDRMDMEFAARHADYVGFSFLRSPVEVHCYLSAFSELHPRHFRPVLKIENQKAVDGLVEMILTAMEWSPVGLLIARGDLAVECGLSRLGALQTRIMDLGELAGMPMFMATQVLGRMLETGLTDRSEMVDLDQALRCDCIMLNRGPFIEETLRFLDQFLEQRAKKIPD